MFPNSIEFHELKDDSLMEKTIAFLSQANRSMLILALWAGIVILELISYEFVNLIEPEFVLEMNSHDTESLTSIPLIISIIDYLIISPFLETLIFQFILLLIIKKCSDWMIRSNSWIYSFVITSLIFSSVHAVNIDFTYYYILWYTFVLIPPAFSFTILAIVEIEKEKGHPIISVWILHSMSNLLPTLSLAISG